MTRLLLVLAIFAVAVMVALSAAAARLPELQMIDLGTLGGRGSVPIAINDRGEIIGEAATSKKRPEDGNTIWHPFLWRNGKMQDLTIKGSLSTTVVGINNRSQIIGSWHSEKTGTHGFVRQNGKMSDLHQLIPLAINDRGDIAGVVDPKRFDAPRRAFFLRRGKVTFLNKPLTGGKGFAEEGFLLNRRGQLVANYVYLISGHLVGCVFRNGRVVEIGDLGYGQGQAFALNDRGEAVGATWTRYGVRRAFTWNGRSTRDLGGLGGDASYAYGINNNGQVVGKSYISGTAQGSDTPSGRPIRQWHATLWSDGVPNDLGTLANWRFSVATGINDNGTAVGYSYRAINSTSDPAGDQRAFAWRNGALTDLGGLDAAHKYTQALAINSTGMIIGLATATPERRLGDDPLDGRAESSNEAVVWMLR